MDPGGILPGGIRPTQKDKHCDSTCVRAPRRQIPEAEWTAGARGWGGEVGASVWRDEKFWKRWW